MSASLQVQNKRQQQILPRVSLRL